MWELSVPSVEPIGRLLVMVRTLTVLAAMVAAEMGLALNFAGLGWMSLVGGLVGVAWALVAAGGEEPRGRWEEAEFGKGGEGLRE